MKIVVFRTYEEISKGIRGLEPLPEDTIFVFTGPLMSMGRFHSRDIGEPFDIAFLGITLNLLGRRRMTPPDDVVDVPAGTVFVVEAKAGLLDKFTV